MTDTYGVKHIGARIDLELLARFDKHYPHISRQFFINECYRLAVEAAEDGKESGLKDTLTDVATAATKSL